MIALAAFAADEAAAVHRQHFPGDERSILRKKSAALATSSGDPARFSAVREMIRCRRSASTPFSGHSTGPGAMAFTRIPGPRSRASARVSITRAALAEQ